MFVLHEFKILESEQQANISRKSSTIRCGNHPHRPITRYPFEYECRNFSPHASSTLITRFNDMVNIKYEDQINLLAPSSQLCEYKYDRRRNESQAESSNKPKSAKKVKKAKLLMKPPPPEILDDPSRNFINHEQPTVVDKNRPAACLFDSSGNLNLTSFSEDSDFEANIKKEDDNFAPIGLDRFVHEL